MLRYGLPLIVLAGLILIFWHGLHSDPSLVKSPLIGKPAPAFSLPALAHPDETITDSILRGQVSLVNVWGTWCISCREEHPTLLAFANKHKVPVYGLDYKDSRDKALAWLKGKGDPYSRVMFDKNGDTAINWGVYGAPETFLIDANGIIRHKYIGPLTPQIIKSDLLPRIAQLRAEHS
ncbi:MAG TPA: DsbE family thiol:disulfide interchange protein [Gammaproteobacteria bacterium]|nr:DsbE family thiol:disulfide interchange protein [Gammaproteobacteria bacterium]